MALSTKSGFGVQAAFFPVTTSVAGPINAVIRNVGVAIQIVAGGSAVRITKLQWRVDLAPDVAAGTVNVPVRWRVFIITGTLPTDMGAFQAQAFASGAHPEIPAQTAATTSNPIWYDAWLDFSAGDPGLNRIAEVDWADAGPFVSASETISAVIVPILDSNIPQALLGAANAQVYLGLFGLGFAAVSGSNVATGQSASLPRYDVRGS